MPDIICSERGVERFLSPSFEGAPRRTSMLFLINKARRGFGSFFENDARLEPCFYDSRKWQIFANLMAVKRSSMMEPLRNMLDKSEKEMERTNGFQTRPVTFEGQSRTITDYHGQKCPFLYLKTCDIIIISNRCKGNRTGCRSSWHVK